MEKVKKNRSARISTKHQITIPVDALRKAGLRAGDRVIIRSASPGRIVLERERDVIAEFAGSMPDVWEPGALDRLRDEWD